MFLVKGKPMKATKRDLELLGELAKLKQFSFRDVRFVYRCPEHRLDRLEKLGLIKKISGNYPDFIYEIACKDCNGTGFKESVGFLPDGTVEDECAPCNCRRKLS